MPSDLVALRRWLSDIHYQIVLAQKFAEGMSYEAFRGDLRTIYAITRSLEIISEASRRLPDELKARHPSIGWRDMAAAGNIYRHEYEDVSARGDPSSATAARRDRARTGCVGLAIGSLSLMTLPR